MSWKSFQGSVALAFVFDACEEAVGVEVVEGGDGHAGQGHGSGQAFADADAGEDVVAAGVDLADHAADPAFGSDLDRFAGVPDVEGAEV